MIPLHDPKHLTTDELVVVETIVDNRWTLQVRRVVDAHDTYIIAEAVRDSAELVNAKRELQALTNELQRRNNDVEFLRTTTDYRSSSRRSSSATRRGSVADVRIAQAATLLRNISRDELRKVQSYRQVSETLERIFRAAVLVVTGENDATNMEALKAKVCQTEFLFTLSDWPATRVPSDTRARLSALVENDAVARECTSGATLPDALYWTLYRLALAPDGDDAAFKTNDAIVRVNAIARQVEQQKALVAKLTEEGRARHAIPASAVVGVVPTAARDAVLARDASDGLAAQWTAARKAGRERNAAIEAQLEEANRRIEQLERKVHDLTQQHNDTVATHQRESMEWDAQLQAVLEQRRQGVEERRTLIQHIETLRDENARYLAELTEVRDRVRSHEAEITTSQTRRRSEIEVASVREARNAKELSDLRTALEKMEDEHMIAVSVLDRERSRLSADLHDISQELTERRSEVTRLNSQLLDERRRVQALQDQYDDLDERHRELKQNFDALASEHSPSESLRLELRTVRDASSRYVERIDMLSKVVDDNRRAIEDLHQMRLENDGLRSQVRRIGDELSESQNAHATVMKQLQQVASTVSTLTVQLQDAEAAKASALSASNISNDVCNNLREEIRLKQANVDTLQQAVVERDTNLRSLKERLATGDIEIKRLNVIIEDLQQQLQAQPIPVAMYEQALDILALDLRDAQEELSVVEARHVKREKDIRDAAEAQEARLLAQLKAQSETIQRLQVEVTTIREELDQSESLRERLHKALSIDGASRSVDRRSTTSPSDITDDDLLSLLLGAARLDASLTQVVTDAPSAGYSAELTHGCVARLSERLALWARDAPRVLAFRGAAPTSPAAPVGDAAAPPLPPVDSPADDDASRGDAGGSDAMVDDLKSQLLRESQLHDEAQSALEEVLVDYGALQSAMAQQQEQHRREVAELKEQLQQWTAGLRRASTS